MVFWDRADGAVRVSYLVGKVGGRVGSEGVGGWGCGHWVWVPCFLRFFLSLIARVVADVMAVGVAPVIRPVPRFYIIEGYYSVTIPGMVAQLPPVEHIDVGELELKVGAS